MPDSTPSPISFRPSIIRLYFFHSLHPPRYNAASKLIPHFPLLDLDEAFAAVPPVVSKPFSRIAKWKGLCTKDD